MSGGVEAAGASRDAAVDEPRPDLPWLAEENHEEDKLHDAEHHAPDHKDNLEDEPRDSETQGVGGGETEPPGQLEDGEGEGDAQPLLKPLGADLLLPDADEEEPGQEEAPGSDVDETSRQDETVPVRLSLRTTAAGEREGEGLKINE